MTQLDNSIKEMKSSMKQIGKLLNSYQGAVKAQQNARNNSQYDSAIGGMQEAYNQIIDQMKVMLNDLDVLGSNCDALDVREYNVLITKTF